MEAQKQENKEVVTMAGFSKGKQTLARGSKPFYKLARTEEETSFKAPWFWHPATEKDTTVELSPPLDPILTLQVPPLEVSGLMVSQVSHLPPLCQLPLKQPNTF